MVVRGLLPTPIYPHPRCALWTIRDVDAALERLKQKKATK